MAVCGWLKNEMAIVRMQIDGSMQLHVTTRLPRLQGSTHAEALDQPRRIVDAASASRLQKVVIVDDCGYWQGTGKQWKY